MQKYIILIGILLLTACSKKDAQYYFEHPKALQTALHQCPSTTTELSCSELQELAEEFNKLAFILRSNPQAFGLRIIKIQNEIAALEHSQASDDKTKLQALKKDLARNIAIVKLFESPEA